MKIICKSSDLSEACQNVQRAVSTKTSIPAVEGILFKAIGNELILTGYDLEIGINTSIPAFVEETGAIILNAKVICEIVRKLPNEDVRIECDTRNIAFIECQNVKYEILGITADEYPELPSVTGGFPVVIESGMLSDMISRSIFAASTNDSKVVHTGLKFYIKENVLQIVGVDGFRLAVRKEVIDYSGEELTFVVPAKTLSELIKLVKDDKDMVSLGVGKRHIVFELGNYSIISRLLDGEFLNYKSALPQSTKTSVVLKTKEFTECIERASLIITDKLKSPLKFNISEEQFYGFIKLSSVTAIGSASDMMKADITGENIEIGFNNKFLLDALKACETDEIVLNLNGPTSPSVILPPSSDKFIYLVLPVRLKNED